MLRMSTQSALTSINSGASMFVDIWALTDSAAACNMTMNRQEHDCLVPLSNPISGGFITRFWGCVQGTTYKGAFHLDLMVQDAGGGPAHRLTRLMGHLPIMLRSTACYLRHLTPCASAPVLTLSLDILSI